jgi:hypothetical protein
MGAGSTQGASRFPALCGTEGFTIDTMGCGQHIIARTGQMVTHFNTSHSQWTRKCMNKQLSFLPPSCMGAVDYII